MKSFPIKGKNYNYTNSIEFGVIYACDKLKKNIEKKRDVLEKRNALKTLMRLKQRKPLKNIS